MAQNAYSAQDLAPIFSMTRRGVAKRALSEHWQSRPRQGRGGGKEWLFDSMPETTQQTIRIAEQRRAVEDAAAATAAREQQQQSNLPALPSTTSQAIMDDGRRYKALAKADLLSLYLDWQRKYGCTTAQKEKFITAYLGGAWPKLLKEVGQTSWKSIERWKLSQKDSGTLSLVDTRGIAHRGQTLLSPRHQTLILGYVLDPSGPAISQCIRQVQCRCQAEGIYIPSDSSIRRWVNAYMAESYDEFVLFREGKKAWSDKCALSILRDWTLVGVGDVVIADGHTLNFETINPDTGKAKRMTIVLYYDGASNCPLGWQVMATENVSCISAAFRRTCIMLGKFPKVVYLDNGKAFRAKFFKGCDDFTQAGFLGLYRDLGCEVIHAWPYHGQSKPIERFFGTMHELEVWQPSYTGYDIDHKPARMKRGEDRHRELYDKMGYRPLKLEETCIQIAKWFEAYKARPQYRTHLHGKTPGEVFEAGRGPGLSEADLNKMTLLMMQKEVRTINKDGIKVNGKLFWHEALYARRHAVLVRYDEMYDPYHVRVYTMEGEFICIAQDREHYKIAFGVHPAARVLGTPEQQEQLKTDIERKRHLEKTSAERMEQLLESDILPEARARQAALEESAKTLAAKEADADPAETSAPSAEEEAAFAEKLAARQAAMEAKPAYVPASTKRWKDSAEKYDYLFSIKHGKNIDLIPEDAAWMEIYEQTPEFQRYHKNRYDGLRTIYDREHARVASA